MIKTFYYNKTAVFLLFLINIFLGALLLISLSLNVLVNAIFIFYFILFIIILVIIMQIIIFCFSFGKVIFSENGIELLGKFKQTIKWCDIKGLYYCDFFIIANNNCLEILFQRNNNVIEVFNDKDYKIFCTKKKYKKIIKLVPNEMVEKNQFLFYSNLHARKKDRFNIYNE